MMFMMFVSTDTAPDIDEKGLPDIDDWVADANRRGRIRGDQLAQSTAATTVRVREGRLHLTDGPFAETKEVIVGYDLLECANLNEAIELVRRHPMARLGRIEIRPFATDERR